MNLQQYRDQNQKVKPNADILERWETRVVACQLSGVSGAMQYLANWGKGLGLKKALMLARQAEIMGDIPMSETFYAKAHELEFKEPASGSLSSHPGDVIVTQSSGERVFLEVFLDGIPKGMQPGKIVTAQPTDAANDRDFYVNTTDYYGQPKVDGQKALVFVTPFQVAYQSRSMKLRQSPSIEMDTALMAAAAKIGPFILEGEVTYLDFEGGEHRTGAQAATYNIEREVGHIRPKMCFYVFDCLYWKRDLRPYGKAARVLEARTVMAHIQFPNIEVVETAITGDEKRRLIRSQLVDGREGEVWFRRDLPYRAGKSNDGSFVRTKYLQEFEANVIGVAPATAEGHYIGGFEIADDEGRPLGNIGTGYSREDQQEILERYRAGNARVKIRCQGFTENHIVWHGRFIGWAE